MNFAENYQQNNGLKKIEFIFRKKKTINTLIDTYNFFIMLMYSRQNNA